jgi:hypothetical protein
MTWKIDTTALDAELDELGIASTRDTRNLLSLLATEPHSLYRSLSRLSELHVPDETQIPAIDRLVDERLSSAFASCTEPSVLRKLKPTSAQCKRLLAVLIRDVGTPVPLAELLLANGLRSATPRRLRELQHEHGSFSIRTFARDRVQQYLLEDPAPDVDACARYWLRSNLRNGGLSPERRALALLSAEVGDPVTRRELDYVLPEETSPGYGLARSAAGNSAEVVTTLRARGYAIADTADGYVLAELP